MKYKWTKIVTEGSPLARSSHGVSVVDDQLIVFGGEHVARTPIDSTVYSLDLSTVVGTKVWNILEAKPDCDIPPPRVGHAQCAVGSKIYVFGGRQGIHMNESPLNDFYEFNIHTRVWKSLKEETDSALHIPSPRSFHKMVAVDGFIYVFGGCGTDGRLADLHSYHLKTGTWSRLPSCELISGRGGAGFSRSADNKSLFVIGGFSGKEMKDVFAYDIATQTWQAVYSEAESPVEPFSVSCGAVVNGCVVFFGGEVEASEKGHEGAGGFSDRLQGFDGKSGRVTSVEVVADGDGDADAHQARSPAPRGWTDADALGQDKLVLFGGLSGNDEHPLRLSDVWVLQPSQ